MKKLFLFTLFAVVIYSSCENELRPNKGSIQFGISSGTNNRATANETPSRILISIKDSNGNFVRENHSLPLVSFGSSYVTESIELTTGNYKVTQFLVLGENGDVLYATPLEDSPLAYLVNDPLPIPFTVSEDIGTIVKLQVIPVSETNTPEDFGYASFTFDIIDPDRDINLSFNLPISSDYVTTGYDSVTIEFISGDSSIMKHLQIISPTEAHGLIGASELGLTSGHARRWEVYVRAYYEALDEDTKNRHINEAVATTTLIIQPRTTKIHFEKDLFKLINGTEPYIINILTWDNWIHLLDSGGFFHVRIKNELCDTRIEYVLLTSDAYRPTKTLVFDALKMADGNNRDYMDFYFCEDPIALQQYAGSFEDFCGSAPSEFSNGSLSINLYRTNQSATEYDVLAHCLLEWRSDTNVYESVLEGI